MKTIAKNRVKRIQEIKDNAIECVSFALSNNFDGINCDPKYAFNDLNFCRHAKLVQRSENYYNVNVHSNLWYGITTS